MSRKWQKAAEPRTGPKATVLLNTKQTSFGKVDMNSQVMQNSPFGPNQMPVSSHLSWQRQHSKNAVFVQHSGKSN